MEATASPAMNPPPILPAFPGVLAAPPELRALADGEWLVPTFVAAGALVVLGDFLFWKYTPGLSLAIFAVAAAVVMLLRNGEAALRQYFLVESHAVTRALESVAAAFEPARARRIRRGDHTYQVALGERGRAKQLWKRLAGWGKHRSYASRRARKGEAL